MTHAEAILSEASFLADMENAIVVATAVDMSQNSDCPYCEYTANAISFVGYLRDYSKLKTRISQMCGRIDRGLVLGNSIIELHIRANDIRNRLKAIWPCRECILRFNPTHKDRFCGRKLKTGDKQWTKRM